MKKKKNNYTALEHQLIQTRRAMYRDFSKFRKYYFPHYHRTEDAAFHMGLAATLNRISTVRNSKLAIAAPRGSAKSTIISLEYAVYSICYNLEKCIILISSTAERASESLSTIKREMETNDRLIKDFPEVCELRVKPEPRRWSKGEIITKNDIMVTALSVGQNIRGKRNSQHRPSLIILDDIEGNEMVQQEDSRYKLQDWFEKSVLKAGDNGTNFIFAGTIHHYGSLLAQYTDRQLTPGWESCIYRSIIHWSEAAAEWQEWANIFCRRKDFGGLLGPEGSRAYFETYRDKMLAGTEVLWPQNKSYYDLMVLRQEGGEASFDSEMQNEPVNPRECLFKVEEFHFWDDKFKDEEALLASIPHKQLFISCDPSMGKSTTHGDFSAIITGVKDIRNKIVYLLDADMSRRQPENLIDTIVSYMKIRKVDKLIFESNNFQHLLLEEIQKRAREKNIHFTTEAIENRKDKIGRIHALEPFLKTGQIQLRRTQVDLIHQFKYFPKGRHDDGPDAVEMLYQTAADYVDFAAVTEGYRRLVEGIMREQERQRYYYW